MPQQKPWEKYAAPTGPVFTDPTQPYKAPIAEADLAAKRQEAQQRDLAIKKAQRDLANTPEADLSPEALANIKAGKPIRLQDLSPGDRGIVSGLLQGNLPPGVRSIGSPTALPYLKMAMAVDPSFNANVFANRGTLLKDYTSGETSKNITALRTAIGHLGHLQTQIGGTFSGPVVPLNSIANSFDKNILGDSGPGLFDQTAGHVGEEATKVFRPQGGAESDVQRNLKDLTSSASRSQKNDNIQNLLALFKSRLEALDTKFKQGMGAGANGFPIIDPTTQQTINQITGVAPPSGPSGPGAPPGGSPSGGGPTSGPGPSSPVSVSGDGSQTVVGTGTNSVPNPEGQAVLAQEQSLLASKAPDDRIRAWAANVYGSVPPHIEDMLRARRAGTPINLVPQEGLLTKNVRADSGMFGTLADAMATSPLAVGVGEAGNAAAAGIPQWLAGKVSGNADLTRLRFDTAANQNPTASTLGQLAGGAAGALGGEALAAKTLTKLPYLAKVLGGGEMAAARGGDALYGGLSGATSNPDDPYAAIKGAVLGAGGGMAGRRVTTAIGSGLRGVTNPFVQKLKAAGVPLTFGQAVSQSGWMGKAIKGTEDGLLSVPLAGDVGAYTRNRGIAAFNRAGFKEGLSGITNDVPPAIGEQGVEMGLGKVSGAFNDALDGQTIKLPLGPSDPFMAAVKAGAGSKTGGDQFIDVLDRNIAPIANKGTITGRDFQQLDRSTDGYARKFDMLANGTPMTPPQPGYEPVAGAFSDMNSALSDAVRTSNPGLMPQYGAAKEAYRNTMVLKDAVNRARNSGGMYMPSQLADAAASNARVFGGTQGTTNQPFFDLTRAGQAVLPSKLADSGTAKRLGIMAATGGLLGGGQFSGNDTAGEASTDAGVTLATLAAAMSPIGQRALRAAVLKRPEWARLAGNTVQNAAPYGGMFGAPVALQLQGR